MLRRPNLLWILTTQWRAQACGFAGDPNARTPFLDQLAARSENYRQAVTPHPFGPFARAAMLTGVASPENGVCDYFDPLPRTARTIAHELRDAGYATAFFGKWHLSNRDRTAPLVGEAHAKMIVPPESRGGFEMWEGFESGFLLNDPWLHGTRIEAPKRFAGYQSDVVCDRAAQWIGEQGGGTATTGRPWFCVVSVEAPHPPYDAPAPHAMRRDPRDVILPANVPRGGEVESRARRELAGYYAHIEATDRAIGAALLARVDLADTRVVFTSVHGDMHGAHGLFRKGWPHEESVRVPLLIGGAGAGVGVTSDEPVSLVDVCERSMVATVGRPQTETRTFQAISMPSVVALPHQCDRAWRGVRTPTRKLVLNPDGTPWLFFDLHCDPHERSNLADDPAWTEERAALRRLIP